MDPINDNEAYKIIKEVWTYDYEAQTITIDRWIRPAKAVPFIQLNFTVTPK